MKEKQEEAQPESVPVEQTMSKEELEALAASGLSNTRKYGQALYELIGVALKDDPKKCQQMEEFARELKAQSIPCKCEEKRDVLAVYIRVR